MKKILYLLLLFTGIANAQIVNIPDANFKAKLLQADVTNTIAFNGTDYVKIDSNNNGEIEVDEALMISKLDVAASNIADLTGIEFFSFVSELNCSFNQLISLDLSNFNFLYKLNCDNNQLTSLNFNNLNVPNGLIEIYCNSNPLSTIDILNLGGLKNLYCANTGISSLDISNSNSLISLDCSSNPISNLDLSNLNNLKMLNINYCNFSSFDVSQLGSLETMLCSNNQLTNLDISSLNNLSILYINFNQLSSLVLSGANMLSYLECKNNQLTNLDFQNVASIETVKCSNNLLTTLDFSNNSNMSILTCNDNNLNYINFKNGGNNLSPNGVDWSNNPNLQFICIDDFAEEFYVIELILSNNGITNVNYNSYCSFNPGGNYNTINGQVQLDADNNGCDVNDGGQSNVRININDGINQGATFTDVNGGYEFFTQAGNHSITPIIENPSFFTFSPTTATITFADNNNNTATQNFCITANGVHPDLEIVIVPITPARPGFEAIYKIVYRNKGNQVITQQYGINFFYNQNLMVYTSSSVTPSSIGVGSTSWDYANLQPFESREILVTMTINEPTDANPVIIGDELTFTSSILPQNGDENTMDNLFILNQTVVGSYDPNDITCLEGDNVSPTQIGNYLHYNVRFENTGTAAAENVVVKVEVNPVDFDINSLQIMNTSHPVDARIRGNIVEFIFQNIMLDSGGHGNILLKIRSQPNLVQGDLVAKKANIYFDYNFPIETNEAETVFQALNNPSFEQDNTIKIFPNPTNSFVNISGNFNIKTTELFDTQGRLLQTNIINENTTTLDISAKSNGVYFIKVTSEEGIKVEKIIKQ